MNSKITKQTAALVIIGTIALIMLTLPQNGSETSRNNSTTSYDSRAEMKPPSQKKHLPEKRNPVQPEQAIIPRRSTLPINQKLGSEAPVWTPGGVKRQSADEHDTKTALSEALIRAAKSALPSLKELLVRLKDSPNATCAVTSEDFDESPPVLVRNSWLSNLYAAVRTEIIGDATTTVNSSSQRRYISPDCAVTLPPTHITQCLVYAVTTMSKSELQLLLEAAEATPQIPVAGGTAPHSERFHLYRDAKTFRRSLCASIAPCVQWTFGQLTDSRKIERPNLGKSNNNLLLQHFGFEVDGRGPQSSYIAETFLSFRNKLLDSTRPTDMNPLIPLHPLRITSGVQNQLEVEMNSTVDRIILYSRKHDSPSSSSTDLRNEYEQLPVRSSSEVVALLTAFSSHQVGTGNDDDSSSGETTGNFPGLIVLSGDSVLRALFYEIVAAVRVPLELRNISGTTRKVGGESWGSAYDSKIMYLVMPEGHDALLSNLRHDEVIDSEGKNPSQPDLPFADPDLLSLESELFAPIIANSAQYTETDVLRLLAPSQSNIDGQRKLRTYPVKWVLSMLKKVCEASHSGRLCPRFIIIFEFDNLAGNIYPTFWTSETTSSMKSLLKLENDKKEIEVDPFAIAASIHSFGVWQHMAKDIVSRTQARFGPYLGFQGGHVTTSSLPVGAKTLQKGRIRKSLFIERITSGYKHIMGRDVAAFDNLAREVASTNQQTAKNSVPFVIVTGATNGNTTRSTDETLSVPAAWQSLHKADGVLYDQQTTEELAMQKLIEKAHIATRDGATGTVKRIGKGKRGGSKFPKNSWEYLFSKVLAPMANDARMGYSDKLASEAHLFLSHLAGMLRDTRENVSENSPRAERIPKGLSEKLAAATTEAQLYSQKLLRGLKIKGAQPTISTPLNLFVYDAHLLQTLFPFAGNDYLHTDCHFSANSRRAAGGHADGRVMPPHAMLMEKVHHSLFTLIDDSEDDDDFGVPERGNRSFISISQPLCQNSGRKSDERPRWATSADLAAFFYNNFLSDVISSSPGCTGWIVDEKYVMASSRSHAHDYLPECAVLISHNFYQCRNILAANELELIFAKMQKELQKTNMD